MWTEPLPPIEICFFNLIMEKIKYGPLEALMKVFIRVQKDNLKPIICSVHLHTVTQTYDLTVTSSNSQPTENPTGGFTWQVLQEQSLERHADGQNTAPDWTLFCPVDCSSSNLQQDSASSLLRLQVGSMTSSAWLIIGCWWVTTKLSYKLWLIKTLKLFVVINYWSVFRNSLVQVSEDYSVRINENYFWIFGLNCFSHLLFGISTQHLLLPW